MEDIYKKLDIICDVWNYKIWDYPFCQSEIRFNDEAKTNYFGDLILYFRDCLDILKSPAESILISSIYSYHISFFQTIFVQQDFIEELLLLFSTNYSKGDLKKDINYSKNRDIRNELVGHPIRRDPTTKKLVSSTLFSFNSNYENIEYLRYHKENNFDFELVKYDIEGVLNRHIIFLNTWLDIVIGKLKKVVEKFKSEIENILEKVSSVKFESLVCLLNQKYKPFLENTLLYDKESILKIYKKRKTHQRYRIVYEKFVEDLVLSLNEQIKSCEEIFTRRFIVNDKKFIDRKPIFIEDEKGNIIINIPNQKKKIGRPKKDYNYLLQKLIDSKRRNYNDFDCFSGAILAQCKNKVVQNELNRMRDNLYDDVEYFSSFKLISKILKN